MEYTKEQLECMGVYDLRRLARSVGVDRPTTKTKAQNIADIMAVLAGDRLPAKPSKRGRPPIEAAGGEYLTAVLSPEGVLKDRHAPQMWQKEGFEALRAVYPSETIRGGILGCPIKKGHRVLITAPQRVDGAAAVKKLCGGLQTAGLFVFALDLPPEEDGFKDIAGEVMISPLGARAAEHINSAEYCLSLAKQFAAEGGDAVMVVYSLDALYRAYFVKESGDALAATQKFFGAGRCLEDGGSLTVLAFIKDAPGLFLDATSALAGAVICLDDHGKTDRERSYIK